MRAAWRRNLNEFCFVFSGLGRLELLTAELGSLAGRGERELAS